jgi:hypothetical protein
LPSWYREGIEDQVEQVFLGIGYLTVAFVTLTAFILHHHVIVSATGVSSNGTGLTFATLEVYAWSIVNAVPTLNLTETFAWQPTLHMTNEWGRVLIFAFKIMLIVPLFQLLGNVFARWARHSSPAVQGTASGQKSAADMGTPVADEPVL